MNLSPLTWIFLHPDGEQFLPQLGRSIAEVLHTTNLQKSISEARRSIEGGAIRFNDQKVHDPLARLLYDPENKEFFIVQRERFRKD